MEEIENQVEFCAVLMRKISQSIAGHGVCWREMAEGISEPSHAYLADFGWGVISNRQTKTQIQSDIKRLRSELLMLQRLFDREKKKNGID